MVESNRSTNDECADARRRILAEVAAARLAGVDRSDESILAEHPELLPELARDLADLRTVEAARQAAFGRQGSSENDGFLHDVGAPVSIPGYGTLEEVHRGGQGVVYQARQISTDRTVAVKIMHEGPFSRERQRARFQREIEILARLRHPNIVRIHDGGVADGRLFCVMDYISGDTLDVHIAERKPSIRVRLRLFAKICDAIHAAHLRGIIHRDIKPANIRIGPEGEPHVLDFGLAKHVPLAAGEGNAAVTMTGQFVGSLSWASPEQLAADPEQVDVRSDVYALGLLLYHMMTGRLPYPVGGGIREVVESITHAEPARPSSLRAEVDHELDAIVLYALRKDPSERYQSAGDLARDIRHYLAGESVEARTRLPRAKWYVFTKFVRRNRVAAAFAATLLLTIILSVAMLLLLYQESRAQAHRAQAALADVQDARAATERNAATALREAEKAEAVNQFLNNMLATVQPSRSNGADRDITLRELLDRAARDIENELAGQPAVEADVRHTIGATYLELGRFKEAQTHLRAAADLRQRISKEPQAGIADSLVLLGGALRAQGDLQSSEQVLREALSIRLAVADTAPHGEEYYASTLMSLGQTLHMRGQYQEARDVLDEALAIARREEGERSTLFAHILFQSSWLHKDMHAFKDAEEGYRKVLEVRRELTPDAHKDIGEVLNNLGLLLHQRGRTDEAEPLLRDALDNRRRVFGDEHPETLLTMNNLAMVLNKNGDLDAAEAIFQNVLTHARTIFGDNHPFVSGSLNNLSRLYSKQDNLQAAIACQREALAIDRRIFGQAHGYVALDLRNLAIVLRKDGQDEESELLFREALAMQRELFDDQHPAVAGAQEDLAGLLEQLGRHGQAEALVQDAVTIRRARAADQPMELAQALTRLARLQQLLGNLDGARASYEEALHLRESKTPGAAEVQQLRDAIWALEGPAPVPTEPESIPSGDVED